MDSSAEPDVQFEGNLNPENIEATSKAASEAASESTSYFASDSASESALSAQYIDQIAIIQRCTDWVEDTSELHADLNSLSLNGESSSHSDGFPSTSHSLPNQLDEEPSENKVIESDSESEFASSDRSSEYGSDPDDIFLPDAPVIDTPMTVQEFEILKLECQRFLVVESKPPRSDEDGTRDRWAESVLPFGRTYIVHGLPYSSGSSLSLSPPLFSDPYGTETQYANACIMQVVFFRTLGTRTWAFHNLQPPWFQGLSVWKPGDSHWHTLMRQAGASFLLHAMHKMHYMIAEKIAAGDLDGMISNRETRMNSWYIFTDEEIQYCWEHLSPGVAIHALTESTEYPMWSIWLRVISKWLAETTYLRHFRHFSSELNADDVHAFSQVLYERDLAEFQESLDSIPSIALPLRPATAEVPEGSEAPEVEMT